MTGAPPPGWYQDPEGPAGQTRWWNGNQWTEHRAAPQPPKPQWSTGPKGPSPWRRFRGWPGWAQATVWVVAGILVLAALVGGEGDSDPKSNAGSDNAATTVEKKRPDARAAVATAGACGASSRRKFAADFNLKTTDPEALATRFARGYGASVRPKVYDACLRAIRARAKRMAAAAKRTRVRSQARQERATRAKQRRARARQRQLEQKAAAAERRRQENADAERQEQEEEQASNCEPGYEPCLDPSASDYDCQGGEGDGPKYTGPVTVTGSDRFDLDRDGDGSGCDS